MRPFPPRRGEISVVLNFTKMEGCGNDYIYVDCLAGLSFDPAATAVALSPRHFAVGADGLICICHSDVADAKMRMFNRDGTEGKMCGNGIRCVAKYLYEHNIVRKSRMTIETLSGVRKLHLYIQNDIVGSVAVDMGKAILAPAQVPVQMEGESVINRPLEVDGETYNVTCMSMGNPHCVTFMNNVDTLDIRTVGPAFELHSVFPDHVNAEFVQVLNHAALKMRVWERGSGETWACGTGACAAAVAAVLNGYCSYDHDITVHLKGGTVIIRYQSDGTVIMTGDAKTVFQGSIEL